RRDVLLEHHQHLVEGGVADLLVALARLLRLGADQPGFLENLHVRRYRRLRQSQRLGDVVDIQRPPDMQQLQDPYPYRGGEALEHLDALFGVDDQKVAAHGRTGMRWWAGWRGETICISFSDAINPKRRPGPTGAASVGLHTCCRLPSKRGCRRKWALRRSMQKRNALPGRATTTKNCSQSPRCIPRAET